MNKYKIKWLFLLLLCYLKAAPTHAQSYKEDIRKLYEIAASIKSLKVYSYSYELKEYTKSSEDDITGKVVCDMNKRLFYNSCTEFDMFCDDVWFYKAVHQEKTVYIGRLEKQYNNEERKIFTDQLFSNNLSSVMIDSVILKHGKLTKYSSKKRYYRYFLVPSRRAFNN